MTSAEVLTYEEKIEALISRLRSLEGAVVAFSGGVDSAMLLHACREALADKVLAVTADSPSLPRAELASARTFTKELGIDHKIIQTHEIEREGYARNASDRCYFCKNEFFEVMAVRLEELGRGHWPVLYGAITDDLDDHRPGQRAAQEHRVLAPLADVGLYKEEIRRYSREHGLATAEKPSLACLASRIPYGTPVDVGLLAQVERAELVLRQLGYAQFRVRHHDTVARVELLPGEFSRAVEVDRQKIVDGIRAAGYAYVCLDLSGYRTGSMNEVNP